MAELFDTWIEGGGEQNQRGKSFGTWFKAGNPEQRETVKVEQPKPT
jgi:hypothetical protein